MLKKIPVWLQIYTGTLLGAIRQGLDKHCTQPRLRFPITPNVVSRSPFICSFSFALKLPSPLDGHGHGSVVPMLTFPSMGYVLYSLISALQARKSEHNTLGCCEHHIKKEEEWEGRAALLEEEAR